LSKGISLALLSHQNNFITVRLRI